MQSAMFHQWDSKSELTETPSPPPIATTPSSLPQAVEEPFCAASNWSIPIYPQASELWMPYFESTCLGTSQAPFDQPASHAIQVSQAPPNFWCKDITTSEGPLLPLHPQTWESSQTPGTFHRAISDCDADDDLDDDESTRACSILQDIHASKPPPKRTKKGDESKKALPGPVKAHDNCHWQEIPPTLREGCPTEERHLFELRWRHRHKSGKDMWVAIRNGFNEKFNTNYDKAALQMKLKRARSKYIKWLDKDVSHCSVTIIRLLIRSSRKAYS